MRKLVLSTLLILVFIAANVAAQTKMQVADFKKTIGSFIDYWQPTNNWANESFDHEGNKTWLPEVGIRGKYAQYKQFLAISKLESLVDAPLFNSGPHKNGINLFEPIEFGHYNPQFLKNLNGLLKKSLKDKHFLAKVKKAYHSYLSTYLQAYLLAYRHVVLDAKEKKEAVDYFISMQGAAENEIGYNLQSRYYDFANSQQGFDFYEVSVCCAFWVRRSVDGTEGEFYQLLLTLMGKVDKAGLK